MTVMAPSPFGWIRPCSSALANDEVVRIRRAQHGPVIDHAPRARDPRAALGVPVIPVSGAAVLPDRAIELLVDAPVVGVGGRLRRLQRGGVVFEQVLEAL